MRNNTTLPERAEKSISNQKSPAKDVFTVLPGIFSSSDPEILFFSFQLNGGNKLIDHIEKDLILFLTQAVTFPLQR